MKTLSEDYDQLRQVKKLLGDRGELSPKFKKSSLGQFAIDNKYLNDFDDDGVVTERDYRIGWNWLMQGKPASVDEYNKNRGFGPRAKKLPYEYYQQQGNYFPADVGIRGIDDDPLVDPLEQTSDWNMDGEVDELDASILANFILQGRPEQVDGPVGYNVNRETYPLAKRLPNLITANFTCDGEDLKCHDDYDGDGRTTEDDARMLYAYTSLIDWGSKDDEISNVDHYNSTSPVGFGHRMINDPEMPCADFSESNGPTSKDAILYHGFLGLDWSEYQKSEKNWETGQITGETYQEFFDRTVDSNYDFGLKHPPIYPRVNHRQDLDGDDMETTTDAKLLYAFTSLVDTRVESRNASNRLLPEELRLNRLEWFNANLPWSLVNPAPPPPTPTPTPSPTGFQETVDTTTQPIIAGTTTIQVSSPEQFEINTPVVIGRGTSIEEYNTIVGYGSLELAKPLIYDHGPGTSITTMVGETVTANIKLLTSTGPGIDPTQDRTSELVNISATTTTGETRIYNLSEVSRVYSILTDEDMGEQYEVRLVYPTDSGPSELTTEVVNLPYMGTRRGLHYYSCTWTPIRKIMVGGLQSTTLSSLPLPPPTPTPTATQTPTPVTTPTPTATLTPTPTPETSGSNLCANADWPLVMQGTYVQGEYHAEQPTWTNGNYILYWYVENPTGDGWIGWRISTEIKTNADDIDTDYTNQLDYGVYGQDGTLASWMTAFGVTTADIYPSIFSAWWLGRDAQPIIVGDDDCPQTSGVSGLMVTEVDHPDGWWSASTTPSVFPGTQMPIAGLYEGPTVGNDINTPTRYTKVVDEGVSAPYIDYVVGASAFLSTWAFYISGAIQNTGGGIACIDGTHMFAYGISVKVEWHTTEGTSIPTLPGCGGQNQFPGESTRSTELASVILSDSEASEEVRLKRFPRLKDFDFTGDGNLTSVDALVYYLLMQNDNWQHEGLDTTKRKWFDDQGTGDYDLISHRTTSIDEVRKTNDLLYILQCKFLPSRYYVPVGLSSIRDVAADSVVNWGDLLVMKMWLELGKPRGLETYNSLKGLYPEACRLPFEHYEKIGTSLLSEIELADALENL
jgi:hypothetical protein